MIPRLVLSQLVALVLGSLAAQLLDRRPKSKAKVALDLCLGGGLGLGLTSCLFFLWCLVFAQAPWLWAVEVVLCGFMALLALKLRRQPVSKAERMVMKPTEPFHRLALRAAAGCYLLLFILWIFALRSAGLGEPHGQWDAWAIWNLRARFIYRAGAQWTKAFTPLLAWSHPDYPLLLPASVTRAWTYLGGEDLAAPALVGALFTLATVGLLTSAVASLRGPLQGYLAGLALLATSQFLDRGASQYADVPLAFFLLATCSLLCLYERWADGTQALLAAAGLSAGLMAWTKNEGILCMLCVTVAWLLFRGTPKRGSWDPKEVLCYLAGLAPGLAVTAYFKIMLATSSDLLSRRGLELFFTRAGDPSSWKSILATFGASAVSFGGFKSSVLLALLLFRVLLGRGTQSPNRTGVRLAALSLGAIAACYSLFYLATPYDLSWHLETSAERLLLQLWPSFLLAFFLWAPSPEEITRGCSQGALHSGPGAARN